MKKIVIAALVAAQLVAGQPAVAATMGQREQARLGVFSGLTVRIPLGGPRADAPRASLGIAPTVRSERADGASRTMIGEGLQLSFTPDRPAELNLAGTRLDRLGFGPRAEETTSGARNGVSTLGWVGIGVAGVALRTVGAYALLREELECGPHEC